MRDREREGKRKREKERKRKKEKEKEVERGPHQVLRHEKGFRWPQLSERDHC